MRKLHLFVWLLSKIMLLAKFSKDGGPLPETPEKSAEEQKEQLTQKAESYHKENRAGLTYTSMEKLNLERPAFQPPTPVNVCQEWVKESRSTKFSPNSCMKDGQNIKSLCLLS